MRLIPFLLAILLALLVLASGCSINSAFSLPGPSTDDRIKVDMARRDVETALSTSPSSMFENSIGMFEARYEYADGPSSWSKMRVILYLAADVFSLGITELIFWPIEMSLTSQAHRIGLAEYSRDNQLAAWKVTRKNGDVIHRSRSSMYEKYVVAAKRPTATGQTAQSGQTVPTVGAQLTQAGVPEAIFAPASATTQSEIVQFKAGIVDRKRFPILLVNGEPAKTATDGTFIVNQTVPMGESTIVLTAVDVRGRAHVRRVAVTRWDPSAPIPSSLRLGNYYALVIGNDSYVNLPPLKTARADAQAIAEELRNHYGYQVELLLDATRHDLVRALASYRNRLGSEDNLLVYYAGHGIEDKVESHGYWLPIDAEADDPSEWLANANITRQLKAMSAKHVIVVADSCYAGTLTRGILIPDRAPGYLERLAARRSRTAFTSGGVEPVADAGSGLNSVFAEALLYELKANAGLLEANELFLSVRRRVAYNSDQTPQYAPISKAGHADGEFLFVAQGQN